jgi:hypothetical protein
VSKQTLADAIAWLFARAEFSEARAVDSAAKGQYADAVSSAAMSAAYAFAAQEFEEWERQMVS